MAGGRSTTMGRVAVQAELVEHAVVGREVGQGDLLLEARVGTIAAAVEAQRGERLEGDDLRQHDLVGQPEVDLVHARGALEVVEHRAVEAQQPRRHGQVVGAVADRLA